MKTRNLLLSWGVALFFMLLYSCTKPSSILTETLNLSGKQSMSARLHPNRIVPIDDDYTPPAGSDLDTVETPTILGQ